MSMASPDRAGGPRWPFALRAAVRGPGPLPTRGTAVVTGAAGGLGQAFVRVLAARGLEVVGCDLAGADRVLDVTDPAACRQLARELEPVVWVNNAGLLGAAWVLEHSDEDIQRTVAVNLLGVVHGTRAAAEVMARREGGRVLNVGSLAAFGPTPGLALYAATKHAVRAWSIAAALELARFGVIVRCVCPDAIWTPMLERVVGDEAARAPFSAPRLLEPEEVARFGIELLESPRLVGSLGGGRGRATLAKAGGMFPRMGVLFGSWLERAGAAGQARARRRVQPSATPSGT
jgi:NAD(P)-dependent dehydrogenase (short-subunit alcohol dehydrogenase family)